MPMQQQNSSFAARLGARVAQVHAEHKDKPVDLGNRRLPGGIRNGVAKIVEMGTKQQTEDNGAVPKGEVFFRARAIVISPEKHDGETVAGRATFLTIPICDVPPKGKRKGSTLSQNWYEYQNFFKWFGILPPDEKEESEAASRRIEAYYFAAMRTLLDPARGPIYISFSTRAWMPAPSPEQPKPVEMVFETWHGQADPSALSAPHDPASGMRELPPDTTATVVSTLAPTPPSPFGEPSPSPFEEPPQGRVEYAPAPRPAPGANGEPPNNGGRVATSAPDDDEDEQRRDRADMTEEDLADEVEALVEAALLDPDGTTTEGAAASKRLEELAWEAGWAKEQTAGAADWAEVGDMAMNPPEEEGAPEDPLEVEVGTTWKFAKRARDGSKLKNTKGQEFPPQEVVVATVDTVARTCTLKTRDGKDLLDLRSKRPTVVKWEWLEPVEAS